MTETPDINLKYFSIKYDSGREFTENVIGEITVDGSVSYSFDKSRELYRLHKEIQKRESSGNVSFFVILSVLFVLSVAFVVMKEFKK
jgi:hypothetical protein